MQNTQYPLVSVVMVNYNGLKYLEKTIPPILNQDHPNYEFLIVDNGSTDGSLEFIQNIQRIRLIQSPEIGAKNFACNYAIDRSNGEYILLLDNDILLTEKSLLQDLYLESKKVASFGCFALSFRNSGETKSRGWGVFSNYCFARINKYRELNNIKNIHLSLISYPHGIGIFFNKELWNKVGGYDDHLIFGGDDNDFGMQLWLMGCTNYLYSKSIQIHLGRSEWTHTHTLAIKFRQTFYAHLYTIVKNYRPLNIGISLICYIPFMFIIFLKHTWHRSHIGFLSAFYQGLWMFLKDLPYCLRKRKEVQSKRVVTEDIFLRIKPPKYD